MNPIARLLLTIGGLLLLAGALWELGSRFGFGPLRHLGRLPGDIAIERPHFRFYFPLATSILVSVLLTLILYLIRRFGGGGR